MKDLRSLDPSEYLKILWRRRWYALAGFVLVSAGAGIYGWRMPNIYRSESRILVESAAIPQDYVRSSDRSSPEERIASIRQQVQSRSFMERMIQEFQLFGYGAVREFSMENAVRFVSRNIQVVSTSANTFTISYSATDAQFAQTFTRRMVEALIQSSNSSRKTRAVETDQFLDEQLRQTERDLTAQEEKIKQFKILHLGELPEQGTAIMNAINALNGQLATVQDALQRSRDQQKQLEFRAQEQKQLSELTGDISIPTAETPAIDKARSSALDRQLAAKQAELAALSSRYTPGHPDVMRVSREVEDLKKQIAASMNEKPELTPMGQNEKAGDGASAGSGAGVDAMQNIEAAEMRIEAEGLKNDIAKREKEKDGILSQMRAYQAKLHLAPAIEQDLMALSREHEALKQQYANLQGKKFQAQMTANLETNKNSDTYKIIDEANLPEKPAFPNRVQIILIGLGAGFVLGIGAAVGRELMDSTLGNEDEVAAVLKLPVLVSISEIPKKQPRRLIGSGGIAKSA